jgi:L-2-hydroxyglutarate oxidase LhgO
VIGAGILGASVANLLAETGKSVAVVERQSGIGMETSSRNSGVIHASLYYPPGSLKATTCVEGRRLLYARCEKYGLPFRKTGKLVVATTERELTALQALLERARQNSAGGVRLIEPSEVHVLEPTIECLGALYSPESGIVDVHELLYHHKKQATENGAVFSLGTTVQALDRRNSSWTVVCAGPDSNSFEITGNVLINAAGLAAPQIARWGGVDTAVAGLDYHFCKGDYFVLSGRYREKIRHLVYPMPGPAGLGVHLTLDLSGQVTAGPDATYVDELDYAVVEEKREAFAAAIRRYLPSLAVGDLSPAYSGIRPKLQGPDDHFRDFFVEDMSELGAPRMIGLIGIESPGLTASEAIAKRVVKLVQRYDRL